MPKLPLIWSESTSKSLVAALVVLGVVAWPALARDAAAANPFRPDRPWIYRTDAPPGSSPVSDPPYDDFYQLMPEEGTATLRLFITVDGAGAEPNLGTGGGTPCLVGSNGLDSDHVCAFNVNLAIGGTGDAEFLSFTPDPALVVLGGLSSVPDGSFTAGQTTFSLSFVNSTTPLAPEALPVDPDPWTGQSVVELGTLVVRSFGPGATVDVLNGEAVRSASLHAIDLGDPSQSLASLSGDPMQPHALAVSIDDYQLAGPAASLQPANGWAWDGGPNLAGYRAALQDPGKFGPAGIVGATITPVFLNSVDDTTLAGADGFIAPWWTDANTPPAAATAVVDFFLAGGDLILLQDDPAHDAIGELLGIPSSASTGSVSNGTAPLFQGPFGTASDVVQMFNVGQLSAVDVAARNGTAGATNADGQITAAYWDENDYAPGAGRLLIIADVDMWADSSAIYSPPNANGTFALNGTAFVVGGEVVTAFLLEGRRVIEAGALPVLAALGVLHSLRRRRR